jgi:hypothetical protein
VPRGAGASDLPIDEYLNQIEELVVRSDERTQAEGQQPEPGHEVSQEQHRRQIHPGATRHRYPVVGLRGWIRLLAPLQRRSCGMDVCISLGTLRGPPDCVEFAVTHFPDQAEGTDLQRHENRQVTGPVNQEDPPMLHGNPPFWEGPSPSDPPVPASPDLPRGCGDGDLPAVRIEVGQPPARTWDADCPAMGGGLCWCR